MIEQIYTDFTTKVLPKVSEGLVITKDYFTDLFGRYVKYLIVTDILWMTMSLIGIVFVILLLKKYVKATGKALDYGDDWPIPFYVVTAMIAAFSTAILVGSTANLIKAIYIPEVRVYEEIKGYMRQ